MAVKLRPFLVVFGWRLFEKTILEFKVLDDDKLANLKKKKI